MLPLRLLLNILLQMLAVEFLPACFQRGGGAWVEHAVAGVFDFDGGTLVVLNQLEGQVEASPVVAEASEVIAGPDELLIWLKDDDPAPLSTSAISFVFVNPATYFRFHHKRLRLFAGMIMTRPPFADIFGHCLPHLGWRGMDGNLQLRGIAGEGRGVHGALVES